MARKVSIPESALQGEHWPLTPEQDVVNFFNMLEARFGNDQSNPLPAFQLLSYVAAYMWQTEKPPPKLPPIPWWVVQALAIGFNKYSHGAASTTPVTLGEAYNLEGKGQGKEPRIQSWLRELRDMRIATAVALLQADGCKIEAALQQQAKLTRLSMAQVRRIWGKYRERASRAVRNLRTKASP